MRRQLTELLDQALASSDAEDRARLSQEAHEIIFAEVPWGLYLDAGYFF